MPNLVIAKRFCGPPYSANGGYFSGMVAAQVPRASFVAESPSMRPLSVRLKAPPPLDTPLAVVQTTDGGVEIREGDRSRHEAGTALYGGDGQLRGRAWALWIEPRSTR